MDATEFQRSILFSSAPTVIGAELKPFALCHFIALEAMENAFVTGVIPTYPDLISAVFVCAHDWKSLRGLMRSPLRRSALLWLWGKLAWRFSIPKAVSIIQKHIEDGMEFPGVKPSKNANRAHSPWAARIYLFLRASGFSDEEAMNMPLTAASILFCAKAESEGAMELLSQDFINAMKRSGGGINVNAGN